MKLFEDSTTVLPSDAHCITLIHCSNKWRACLSKSHKEIDKGFDSEDEYVDLDKRLKDGFNTTARD